MTSPSCTGCRNPVHSIDFSMAFHPIVNIGDGKAWGYEALVRGVDGSSAYQVLSQVTDENRYRFDQDCRVKAIELAGRLFEPGSDTRLSINFMPNAVYEPSACIRSTLASARKAGFPLDRIMFEFTEDERISDTNHIQRIVAEYQKLGFITALDDFGAGYAGLNLLASFQPDLIKLDMGLIRGIDTSHARQAIVASITNLAVSLGIEVVAEGVETEAELYMLRLAGIRLFQGYLFAKPALEALPPLQTISLSMARTA